MSFFKRRRTLAPTPSELYNRNIPPYDIKKPIMIYKNLPNGKVEYYSNETGRLEDNGERRNKYFELYKDGLKKVDHYLVKNLIDRNNDSIQECFKNFVIGAEEIKRRTKGKIDFFQYGLPKPTIDKAFMAYNLGKVDKLYAMEKVEKWDREDEENDRNYNERELIESCSGALIFIKRHMKLTVSKYDYNSKYGASLCDENLFIPVKRGILMELTDEELLEMIKNDKHLLITRNLDLGFPMESHELYSPLTLREMKKRKVKGHFTNYELKEALKLGALLWTTDKEPDFEVVVYPKETHCIKASEWYGWYVKDLYQIKKRPETWQGKVLAKYCLTRIWGQHCEREMKWPVKFEKRVQELDGESVLSLNMDDFLNGNFVMNSEKEIVAINKPRNQYKGWIPRIKQFLLTFTRVEMLKQCNIFHIEGYDIIRIHTDSFWLNKKIENFVNMKGNAQDIGRLGYEGDQEVDTELIRSRINRPN